MSERRRILPSLRTRIIVIVLACGLLPAGILCLFLLHYYESKSIEGEVIRITSQAQVISNDIITSGYMTGEDASVTAELITLGNAYSGRIMVIDSSLKVVKDTYDMYEDRTFIWENVVLAAEGETNYMYDKHLGSLIVTLPIASKENADEIFGVLFITESTDVVARNMEFFRSLAIVAVLVILLGSVAAAFFSSVYLVQPLTVLRDQISDIEKGIKTDELSVTDYRETEEISEQFNSYNDKLRLIDDSRQEFVSNVSHELKTPLTSMKVLADSINSMGGEAPLEMYQEFMGDITNEIDRETRIINELLSLVKLDKSAAALEVSPVNMNELLEILLKRLKPIAEKQSVELVLESFRPVTAEVDEVKFSLAIMNLIENAIKYNREGGWVHVSLNSDHQYVFIRVEDNGLGIPEESLDHVFERFYRADKSHSSKIGGTGLGLAITYDAIRLHHGEILVASELGEGTTFDVRIPLKYISGEEDS